MSALLTERLISVEKYRPNRLFSPPLRRADRQESRLSALPESRAAANSAAAPRSPAKGAASKQAMAKTGTAARRTFCHSCQRAAAGSMAAGFPGATGRTR